MAFDMSASLPLILLGIVLLVLAVWLLLRLNRKAKVVDQNATTKTDVLSEGAERAKRNQTLIDAPLAPAVSQGPLSAAANTQGVAAAPLGTDAEAGPQLTAAPVPTPTPTPTPTQAAASPLPLSAFDGSDELARIKGVGPKLVTLLGELGVTTYAQIATWSDADVTRIDAQLGRFKGRITRDQWVEQAKLLAAGDETAFTDKFGRNG
jgi:predicted flap endonuclease-1-like 5' DNA nuclease